MTNQQLKRGDKAKIKENAIRRLKLSAQYANSDNKEKQLEINKKLERSKWIGKYLAKIPYSTYYVIDIGGTLVYVNDREFEKI